MIHAGILSTGSWPSSSRWILTRVPWGIAGEPSALLGMNTSNTPKSFLVIHTPSAPVDHPLKSPNRHAAFAPGAHSR